MSTRHWLLSACAIVLVIALTAAVFLPAAWVGGAVSEHTRLRLLHSEGTLWRGSAILALSDGRNARTLPGRVAWRVHPASIFQGRLGFVVRHPTLEDTVRISYDGRILQVAQGRLTWPASLLELLGAPFNTISPGGTLRVQWKEMNVSDMGFDGTVRVDWANAQSALSPVVPLGDYRVVVQASGGEGEATLRTLTGPLLLRGDGRLQQDIFRFSGTADAEPEMRPQLNGLIGVLGPRSGEKVLLNWELRF